MGTKARAALCRPGPLSSYILGLEGCGEYFLLPPPASGGPRRVPSDMKHTFAQGLPERKIVGPQDGQSSTFSLIREGRPPTEIATGITTAALGVASFLSCSQELRQAQLTSVWCLCTERLLCPQHDSPPPPRGLGKRAFWRSGASGEADACGRFMYAHTA